MRDRTVSVILALLAFGSACGDSASSGDAPARGDAGEDAREGSVVPRDAGAPFDAGAPLPSCDPGAAPIQITIDATRGVHAISPYVYGTNLDDWAGKAKHLTLGRNGGNRWTAYNWETNASNAGSDYVFSNDAYLSASKVSGEAIRARVAAASQAGAASIVTIPMQGYVAADESGAVDPGGDPATSGRFLVSRATKGAAAVYPPDTTDRQVNEDELVTYLQGKFGAARATPLLYALDNEPDLWTSTHAEIQKAKLTYAALAQKSADHAGMIKTIAPDAWVLGFVSYGWSGYVDLQGAPDAAGRDFTEYFLDRMKAAEGAAGHRLVDVLDLHYYTEARGDDFRVSETQPTPTQGAIDVRVQSPRSLWDPSYVEPSWITRDALGGKAIRLVPRMKEKIAAHYPGTRLAFSEYEFGQGDHISGAIAEADALGIFGREDVFLAAHWPLHADKVAFTYAAFAMFRSYDGQGGAFGDTSIFAETSDAGRTSVYASVDAGGRVVIVAINKTGAPLAASFRLAIGAPLSHADAFQLTSAAASPVAVTAPVPACQAFLYSLPAMSVTTLVVR